MLKQPLARVSEGLRRKNNARSSGITRKTFASRSRRRSQVKARELVEFPLFLLPPVFRRRRGSFGVLNRAPLRLCRGDFGVRLLG